MLRICFGNGPSVSGAFAIVYESGDRLVVAVGIDQPTQMSTHLCSQPESTYIRAKAMPKYSCFRKSFRSQPEALRPFLIIILPNKW